MADSRSTQMRNPRRGEMRTEEKMFDERVVYVNRVARVVKGGRRFRFQALVIVGDHKGRVGVGVSKGADVSAAVTKATEVAKKHLLKIPMHNNTLTHDVEGKVAGSRILILPAAPGTGLIAGGVVRTVLEVAGIENALSKSLGSSNRVNTAYASIDALAKMKPASEWVTVKNSASSAVKKTATAETETK
jgi:small subunit ribosomal protein S5